MIFRKKSLEIDIGKLCILRILLKDYSCLSHKKRILKNEHVRVILYIYFLL